MDKNPIIVTNDTRRYIRLTVFSLVKVERKLELKYVGKEICKAEKKPTMPIP